MILSMISLNLSYIKINWEGYSGNGMHLSFVYQKDYWTIGSIFSKYDIEKGKIQLSMYERGISLGTLFDFFLFTTGLKINAIFVTPLRAKYEDIELETNSQKLLTASFFLNLKIIQIRQLKIYISLSGEAGFYSHYKGLLGLNILL